jgi:hypothetical protein
LDEATARACRTCGVIKPIEQFGKHSGCAEGRRYDCNPCRKERRNAWAAMSSAEREADRDARREAMRREEKVCSKCGVVKAAAEFYARGDRPGGLVSKCRECVSALAREYHQSHREERNAASKQWRAENKELFRQICRDHYERNREQRRQAAREAYDSERQAERNRKFNERRPEYKAEYRRSHPEMFAEVAARRRAQKHATEVEKIDFETLWTGLCGICGEPMDYKLRAPDSMSKSIDHITPLSRGGSHTRGNLQWAHLGCNRRKGAKI